jgi:hypothetical protein
VRKRNFQRQKKSDPSTKKNVESGGGQDLGGSTATQCYHTYSGGDSWNNTAAAEGSVGTSLYPCWLKTSDSDFSDAEAGQVAKIRVTQGKVRKAALSLLACISKVTVAPYVCSLHKIKMRGDCLLYPSVSSVNLLNRIW